jgi:transcriptional regulator GlxA family with amidase domain
MDFSRKDILLPAMVSFHKDERPFRIGFLLIDGFALMSYASATEPLRAANDLAGRTLYDVQNISVTGGRAQTSGAANVRTLAQIGEQIDFDIVFVCAGPDPQKFCDKRVLNWLRHLARRGVALGGVSGGPVILAAAGLMNGYRMTVHWEHAPSLVEISPSLQLEKSIFVVDRDRYTCAGGIAPLDMMHELITGHHGQEFATRVSDWFMHTEIRASGQPQRAGYVARYGTTSAPVIRAIEAMENHVDAPLDLNQIADLSGVGPRQLNRLFSEKIGVGTMAFYRDLRLEKAKNLLGQSPLSITEIALATGFCSSAHFAKSFRGKFDAPPSAFRK